MADKKKPNSADDRPHETDRQFLERSTIGNLMKDVLSKIVSNRPVDPISFLADYFETLDDQSNLVLKARQIIEMTHHSRPVFESNVRMAYDTLMKQKVNKRLYGIIGSTYTDLLKTLCRDIPQPVTNKLLRKLECVEYEAIRFDVFRSGVFTCCVLQDYVKLAELLFQSLDFQRTGKVDKTLCDTVNEQLKTALAGMKTDARNPPWDWRLGRIMARSGIQEGRPIVEAGYNLGPDGLYFALERAMRRDKHSQVVQTQDQFTVELCDAFLSKVKKLK